MPCGFGLVYNQRHSYVQLTFPTPLMTPPDTSTYFMVTFRVRCADWGREGREEAEFYDA